MQGISLCSRTLQPPKPPEGELEKNMRHCSSLYKYKSKRARQEEDKGGKGESKKGEGINMYCIKQGNEGVAKTLYVIPDGKE